MPIFFDITIRISSNYETEEELMRKFEEWFNAARSVDTDLWQGNSCVVRLGVDKVNEPDKRLPATDWAI
jgi:hypothetical protein